MNDFRYKKRSFQKLFKITNVGGYHVFETEPIKIKLFLEIILAKNNLKNYLF